MRLYKTTRELIAEDAAYVAGLIDGEGTITLARRHAKDRRQLVVSIANTERPILDYVLKAVGTGKITGKRTTAEHHTPSYCYSVSNRQALSLLAQVRPYLRSHKRERAVWVLGKYLEMTPRNGKYTPTLDRQRQEFEQALLAINSRSHTERTPRTSDAVSRQSERQARRAID